MLRNVYLILSCAIAILSIASCAQQPSRYTIGVSQCSDDEWRHQVNQEIVREAMFYDGVSVEIRTVKDNTEAQKQDIRYFMEKGVDLIIVAPNEAAPMTPIIEEAYDQGIAIIVFDRNILSDKYTAWVGADNYEIGKSVGNYIASMLGGKGRVAELTGLAGSTPAIDRHQGFMSAVGHFPEIELLCQEDAGWLRESAEEKMGTVLLNHDSIDVVYAQNDRMAAGAYQAASMRGRENEMRFIGIDALHGDGYGLDLVEKGVIDATFIYPTGGDKLIQIAMDILEGRHFPRETILNTAVVDSTNARVMALQTNQISALDNKIKTLNGKIDIYLSRYGTQQVMLYGSLLIMALFAGLLILVVNSLRAKNRLNKELELQKGELETQKGQLETQRDQLIDLSKQLEEATHAKLVFFTNISHDFRTPLTLVADPVDHLLADESLSAEQQKLLQLVKRNVNILLRLVNQILDFRKYENGKLEFAPVQVDFAKALQGWNSSFLEAARRKHIHFSFSEQAGCEMHSVWADVEKLERIYYNLLSNAFKFTPENGKISVSLSFEASSNSFRLEVSNTGNPISPEHIRSIFNRFYKIDMHHSGSGIGLALVKAFVELHNGTVTVESDPRQGTVFTIHLPAMEHGETHPATQQQSATQQPDTATPSSPMQASSLPDFSVSDIEEEPEEIDPDKPLLLIIDDNADIRIYIRELMQGEFSTIEAADGMEGIRKAMKYVPDVIVSDVMMPGIDGVECCRRLKSELQTCHIPIILLTACSLDEQRIQGYDGGADSYISKPFNSQVLLSRINNLIESNKRMRQTLNDSQIAVRENVCDMDKEFVEKFKRLIEENLSDTALNVEDLGKQMGLSRVQLYRKIKSLTNYAPNELLRTTRLRKAVSLLSSTEMNIAEICYEVGFTSPSYFSKCYKEQYGETPTEFLKRKKQ